MTMSGMMGLPDPIPRNYSFLGDGPGDIEDFFERMQPWNMTKSECWEKAGNMICSRIMTEVLKTGLAPCTTLLIEKGIYLIYKCSPAFQKLIHGVAKASLNKPLYGAAAVRHVSKMFRSYTIVNVGIWTLKSGWHLLRYFWWGGTTWEQTMGTIFKNGMSHGGDMLGWMFGSIFLGAVGVSAFPAALGAFVFAYGGRMLGEMLSDKITGDGGSEEDD